MNTVLNFVIKPAIIIIFGLAVEAMLQRGFGWATGGAGMLAVAFTFLLLELARARKSVVR